MPTTLGTIIAERRLERPGSTRPVLARLGRPRRSRQAPWECPYQVVGAGDTRVRVGLGEDALQSLLHACVGLRLRLVHVHASWLSEGVSGIPSFIPDAFGEQFATRLEALVEREVAKLAARLERTYNAKQKRLKRQPSNTRVKPTAVNNRGKNVASSRRGLRAKR